MINRSDVRPMAGRMLSVEAVVSHGIGAASRLLADVERFGFDLVDFRFLPGPNGEAIARFVVSIVSDDLDKHGVRARFERHPSVRSVHVVEKSSTARIVP